MTNANTSCCCCSATNHTTPHTHTNNNNWKWRAFVVSLRSVDWKVDNIIPNEEKSKFQTWLMVSAKRMYRLPKKENSSKYSEWCFDYAVIVILWGCSTLQKNYNFFLQNPPTHSYSQRARSQESSFYLINFWCFSLLV